MIYKKHNGALTVPFDGIQSRYLNNETDEGVYVGLNIASAFEEIETN